MSDPNGLEGRPDPERDFPRRFLRRKKFDAWVDAHNPHPRDSLDWHMWVARFHLHQIRSLNRRPIQRFLVPIVVANAVVHCTIFAIRMIGGF